MTEVLSSEDAAYLRACVALNIDPNTGQKLTSTGESGNGLKDAIVKREREKREREKQAYDGHRMRETAKQRTERERRELREAWCAHYEHMSRAHLKISEDYAQKRADLLRMGS